jgi:hypothetical protein
VREPKRKVAKVAKSKVLKPRKRKPKKATKVAATKPRVRRAKAPPPVVVELEASPESDEPEPPTLRRAA